MYKYKARCTDVYDGDSVTLDIDLGFNIYLEEKCRLIGIDTPEIRTKNLLEKKLGYEARDYLRELILDKEVIIETTKEGKFGRYLVSIHIDGLHVNQHLIDKGFAKPYLGGKRTPWTFD